MRSVAPRPLERQARRATATGRSVDLVARLCLYLLQRLWRQRLLRLSLATRARGSRRGFRWHVDCSVRGLHPFESSGSDYGRQFLRRQGSRRYRHHLCGRHCCPYRFGSQGLPIRSGGLRRLGIGRFHHRRHVWLASNRRRVAANPGWCGAAHYRLRNDRLGHDGLRHDGLRRHRLRRDGPRRP